MSEVAVRLMREHSVRIARKNNTKTSTIIMAAFVLAAVFTLVVGVAALLNMQQEAAVGKLIAHTQLVREQLSLTKTQLIDSETAQRGFIIANDPSYLEPYTKALALIPSGLSELRRLTADNPVQQVRLDRLEPLVRERLSLIAKTIALMHNTGFEAAAQVVSTDRGKNAMDEIRALILTMDAAERELLAKHSDASRKNASMTVFTVTLGVVFSMLIALLSTVLLRRDNAKRYATEAALEESNFQLLTANDQVQALAALGDALQVTRTIGEVATVTADRIAPMLRVDYLALSRRDNDVMRLVNVWGQIPEMSKEQLELGIQQSEGSLVWRVVESNQSVYTQAYPLEAGYLSNKVPDHAIAMEPVRGSDGQVLAVVAAGRSGTGAWSQSERTMLERAAITLGLALERAEATQAIEDLQIQRIKQAAENQVHALAESQKRFVSDASHELRAPLTAIQGNLELLRRYPDMPAADRNEALLEADREATRLGRLVVDLLALARGDTGAAVQTDELELKPVLLEAWTQMQRFSSTHQFELLELENPTVVGNRDRLKQLVLILLENAVKYTARGGLIQLSLRTVNHQAELRVIDTGNGIAPSDLPHVFERFYRADQSRTRGDDPGGTGLGLPIARWIAELHGGEIQLESQVGHGTSAVVRLPCVVLSTSQT
jgi:signal transduction histidine kinase/CHASE3 domain sensor protein